MQSGNIGFDTTGTGNQVQQVTLGGTSKIVLAAGSPTTATQIKTTVATPGTTPTPAFLARIINGATAQTNTVTFYDSATSAGCTAANAIYTAVTLAASSIVDIEVPCVNGLWYSATGAFTGPLIVTYS